MAHNLFLLLLQPTINLVNACASTCTSVRSIPLLSFATSVEIVGKMYERERLFCKL